MNYSRCVVWLSLLAAPLQAAEPVWNVQQLMAAKTEWDRLLNAPVRVEGRVSTVAKSQLRFIKCDLAFRITEDQARVLGFGRNAEVVGRLVREKESNRFAFDVVSAKTQPVDGDQFRERESALKNPRPDDWYALGQWAGDRGKFYDDAELIESSRICLTRGLGIELRDLSSDDVDGRFRLATKSRELGLPETLGDELRHEAYRAWWTRATTAGMARADDLTALLKRAAVDWPGAASPLAAWPTELQAEYARDPLGTYRQSDAARRSVLQRIFIGQAQLREITGSAAADGKNGAEIAARIEQLVPERRTLAEQYREQSLRYRQSNIGTGTKTEAVELATAFRQRGEGDQATETLRRWLAARAQKVSKTPGAPEHLALADDYWSLLKDEATTVAHLEAARRLEPESEDVQARYRELGYEWNGSRWGKPAAVTPTPATPSSPKDLAVGLTSTDVRRIQGVPSRVATVISGQSADEFWIYDDERSSRLVIQFSRRLHQSDPRVVRIYLR